MIGIKQLWGPFKTSPHVDAEADVIWYKVIHVISPNFMQSSLYAVDFR